jgi:hypothetical protein
MFRLGSILETTWPSRSATTSRSAQDSTSSESGARSIKGYLCQLGNKQFYLFYPLFSTIIPHIYQTICIAHFSWIKNETKFNYCLNRDKLAPNFIVSFPLYFILYASVTMQSPRKKLVD